MRDAIALWFCIALAVVMAFVLPETICAIYMLLYFRGAHSP
jgi:hypothetical protein